MSYRDTAFEKTVLSILNNVATTRFKGLECNINITDYSNANHHFQLKSHWKLSTTTSMKTHYGRNSSENYSSKASIETAVDNYTQSIQSLSNNLYKSKLLEKVSRGSPCNHLDQKEIWLGTETCDFSFDYSCNRCSGRGDIQCSPCKGTGYTNCPYCDNFGITLYGDRKSVCINCNSPKGKRRCTSCSGQTRVQCKPCNGRGGFTDFYEVSIKAQKTETIFNLQPSNSTPEKQSFIEAYALSEHRNNHVIIESTTPEVSCDQGTASFVTNGSTIEHKASIEVNGSNHDTYFLGEKCSVVDYGCAYDEIVRPLLDDIENQNANSVTAQKQLFKTEAAETISTEKGKIANLGVLAVMYVLSTKTIQRILKVYTEYENNLGNELNIPIGSYLLTTLKFALLLSLFIIGFDSVTFGEVPYGQLGIMPLYTYYTMYEFKLVAIASITAAACLSIPAILIFGRRNKFTLTRLIKSFVFGTIFVYAVLANVYYIFEFMGQQLNIEMLNLGFVSKEALVSIPGLLAIAPEIICTALLLSFLRVRKKSYNRIALALKNIKSESLKKRFKV